MSGTLAWQEQLSFAETFSTSAPVFLRDPVIEEEEGVNGEEALKKIRDLLENSLQLSEKTAISHITIERHIKLLCDSFLELPSDEILGRFLQHLSQQTIDRSQAQQLARDFLESPESPRREDRLRQALTPPYVWLFKKIAQLEGGVKFLVDLRAQLISLSQTPGLDAESSASLRMMNQQLKQLLSHWFSVGFLDLEQVTWSSPCAMLQKVSDYEAVHPMRNWTDLKARVGPYRRCFVYTHKSMPGEPIVVLHVALKEDIPESISSVVKHHRLVKRFSVDTQSGFKSGREGEDVSLCQAAIFYSITSTQRGLQGIELGTYLIKQAVQSLREEIPNLIHFSTLSPIPGFRTWLLTTMQREKRGEEAGELFYDEELDMARHALSLDRSQILDELYQQIKSNNWVSNTKLIQTLETPLMRLCGRYLYLEKRRNQALDSVANFHLRNGAVMWRINWKGDMSARGLTNSCGIMVNYKYFIDDLEDNSTEYQENHTINAGEQVLHLATQIRSL